MTYDAICPHCGKTNRDLYLEETGGWMECEYCGEMSQSMKFMKSKKLPVFRMDQLPEIGNFIAQMKTG